MYTPHNLHRASNAIFNFCFLIREMRTQNRDAGTPSPARVPASLLQQRRRDSSTCFLHFKGSVCNSKHLLHMTSTCNKLFLKQKYIDYSQNLLLVAFTKENVKINYKYFLITHTGCGYLLSAYIVHRCSHLNLSYIYTTLVCTTFLP